MDNIDNEVVTEENQAEHNYNSFQINTRNALKLIFEIEDYDLKIEHDLLVEFRNRIEDTLITRVEPTEKFDPVLWHYYRDKCIQLQRSGWRKEGANVFDPDYFMFDARKSGETRYSSLSKEDKKKVDKSAKKAKEDDWSRWGYDYFSLYANCPLSIEKDGEEFQFFFAWQLRFTEYFKIESFLQEQFEHSFLGDVEDFKKFIKILFRTYKHILTDSDNRTTVFEYIDNLKEIDKTIIDTDKMQKNNKKIGKEEVEENTKKAFTETQWVLVYYYFFKYLGIEVRKNTNIATIARFIHLGTDTKFTTNQNSDIYKKLSKAPNINTNKQLVKDLTIIKSLFIKFEIKEVIQLIDSEIVKFKNELDSEY